MVGGVRSVKVKVCTQEAVKLQKSVTVQVRSNTHRKGQFPGSGPIRKSWKLTLATPQLSLVIGFPVIDGSTLGSCGTLGGTGFKLKPGGHSSVKGGGQIIVGAVVSVTLMT